MMLVYPVIGVRNAVERAEPLMVGSAYAGSNRRPIGTAFISRVQNRFLASEPE